MSPVTDEVRQQGKEHPRGGPEQLQGGAGERTVDGRKQFARHYYSDKPRTLHARHTHTPRPINRTQLLIGLWPHVNHSRAQWLRDLNVNKYTMGL